MGVLSRIEWRYTFLVAFVRRRIEFRLGLCDNL